jgi:TrmH RNA methyltransferase
MSEHDNPYRGPKRGGGPQRPRDPGGPRAPSGPRAPQARRDPPVAATSSRATVATAPGARHEATRPPRPARDPDEVRLYGLNACRAAFAARPGDLRKVYLSEARIGALRDVLAWCVKHRLGYRVVEEADLERLAAASHHEGVVFEMLRRPQPTLAQLLAGLAPGPHTLVWLDGVGNPHNFGAVLRSAAHFGAAGVLLPPDSPLSLSGAASRVAEGGAEALPVVRLEAVEPALAQLAAAGFVLAATLPAGGLPVFEQSLPPRLVLVFGAEGSGMHPALVAAAALRLSIPGSGRVESLNIATAAGVMLAEAWRRQRR